jgi:predicted DNA-binding protein (MmcQ/YjbR family)
MMDGERLLDIAEETAGGLRSAVLEHPFGPDWEVYKVGGKVFLLTTQVPGQAVATLKCAPEDSAALAQEHKNVTPGYHMNKRHWVSMWPGDDVSEDLLRDLVKNSYRLVAETIPRDRRPLTTQVEFATEFFERD